MTYFSQCQHTALIGVGDLCLTCYNKPPKEPSLSSKQDALVQYNRDHAGVQVVDCLIEHNGLYKRINGKWGERDEAKVYATLGRAQMVINRLGYGEVQEVEA